MEWRRYHVECFDPLSPSLVIEAPSWGMAIEYYCALRGILSYNSIVCVPTNDIEEALVVGGTTSVEPPTEGTKEDLLSLYPDAEAVAPGLDLHHRPVLILFGAWRDYANCLNEIRKGVLYEVGCGPELLTKLGIGWGPGELRYLFGGGEIEEPRWFREIPSKLIHLKPEDMTKEAL